MARLMPALLLAPPAPTTCLSPSLLANFARVSTDIVTGLICSDAWHLWCSAVTASTYQCGHF